MESQERVHQFDRVIAPHLSRAYNLARLLVGNAADAEDLVQEASLRAFRGLDSFHGGDSKTWLLVIVRNACYTFLGRNRRTQNEIEFAEEEHPQTDRTPEVQALATEDSAAVRKAIEELPAEFREAVVLREIEELSYREIAEITGAPVGTVMSRLSRARAHLRARLQTQSRRGARP
jgi:RNA polymerase sigma-70 factor (ECF subfamily)